MQRAKGCTLAQAGAVPHGDGRDARTAPTQPEAAVPLSWPTGAARSGKPLPQPAPWRGEGVTAEGNPAPFTAGGGCAPFTAEGDGEPSQPGATVLHSQPRATVNHHSRGRLCSIHSRGRLCSIHSRGQPCPITAEGGCATSQPGAAVLHSQPGAAVLHSQPGAAVPHSQPRAAVNHTDPKPVPARRRTAKPSRSSTRRAGRPYHPNHKLVPRDAWTLPPRRMRAG